MKLLGSLAILSFAVISTAVEINSNEENEYGEYCSVKCKDVCGQCEVQRLCNLEHETKCGIADPDPDFHEICKPHEICVPKDHNCKQICWKFFPPYYDYMTRKHYVNITVTIYKQ